MQIEAGGQVIPAQLLMDRLPLALALVDGAGTLAWSNRRFAELFEPAVIGRPGLLEGNPGPLRIRLPGKQGADIDVRVHCLQAARHRLLVLDDTPGQADAAAVAALKSRLAELEQAAMIDGLTGAWNRRYLDHAMQVEMRRSARYRQPLAAAMLDIDHFKRVNDTWGHPAGDVVLRELVLLARESVRATDAVVRWGGEEFVILMPYTDHRTAAGVAEKLRAAAARHDFPAAGHVTVSFGVAELLAGEAAGAFFERLDRALYRAKGEGRDRVVADARGASDAWAQGGGGILNLTWRAEYACGEARIDAQHEELFRLANALLDASFRQGADKPGFDAALDACLAHIARHFADEERILAARGYDRLAQHQAAHRMLLERAGALKAAAAAGDVATGALVEFLVREVVAQHLLAADREFFPLFARPA